MKKIFFEIGESQNIEISVGYNYFKKYINEKKYNNYIIFDKKVELINKMNLNNSIALLGNENLKSLDKYLTLILKLSEYEINSVHVFGGYSVLDFSGYVLENIGIENYYFFPTTLNSAIMLPIKGKYYLNFNWKKDFLTQKGYPSQIKIDTKFFESLPEKDFRNMFVVPYIIGKILNSKISDLALNYSKMNFSNIDLQDFVFYSSKQWIYYIKNENKIFPGENVMSLFYNKQAGFDKNYSQIFAISFIIELYISWYYGFLNFETFEKIEKEMLDNFDISYKLVKNIDIKNFYCKNKFLLFTSSGKLIEYKIPYDELKTVIKEVKEYFRGGFL
ncbi:3-dehydroquinate synthase [Marinitoga hydrogenitolerans DSM 16785]|uniref:3-dehydroquinate synthase n=1 Tax=Marinitoga hydrogenitolerans (strain DSM 16785 / JCM 12826 / AT1271) TaxID=1122195 RepID=A0A1M4Z630_MARH1|nr:hypothetical protein [Marinitoga hydrogenitolerans]SHF13484.1 3-dehydroquinate synthase [Marinitoga hydrogenitolerans DSM 16785]